MVLPLVTGERVKALDRETFATLGLETVDGLTLAGMGRMACHDPRFSEAHGVCWAPFWRECCVSLHVFDARTLLLLGFHAGMRTSIHMQLFAEFTSDNIVFLHHQNAFYIFLLGSAGEARSSGFVRVLIEAELRHQTT